MYVPLIPVQGLEKSHLKAAEEGIMLAQGILSILPSDRLVLGITADQITHELSGRSAVRFGQRFRIHRWRTPVVLSNIVSRMVEV